MAKGSVLMALAVVAAISGCATNQSTIPESAKVTEFYTPAPLYPRHALIHRINGCVVVQYNLDSHGIPKNIRVVKSYPEGVFDAAAINAMKRSRPLPYKPDKNKIYYYTYVWKVNLNETGYQISMHCVNAEQKNLKVKR